MQWILALIALLVLALTGCYSVPVEDLSPAAIEPPLSSTEIDRLSRAGLSDPVILETIDHRGIERGAAPTDASDRVLAAVCDAPSRDPLPQAKPACGREIVIPLWPSYSAGRWHWGVRIEARPTRPAAGTP